LWLPMKKLAVNPVPCTGCLNCTTVCALRRAGAQDGRASAFRVELDVFGGLHGHVYCRQCDDAACAAACPRNAISRDEATGAWTIDRSVCERCGACAAACPFGAMFWWSDERGPVKCDLCGGDPACASACRFGVIRFLDQGDPGFSFDGMPAEEQDPGLGRGPGTCR